MQHCSDSHEEIHYSIIPNKPPGGADVNTADFPAPDVSQYLQWNLSQKIRGMRLYKTYARCQYKFELEVVHYLPKRVPHDWQYSAEFMVTRIQTDVNFTRNTAMQQILENITVENILGYNIRYGMVDFLLKNFALYDGLYTLFLTNPGSVPTCNFTTATISQLKDGISSNVHNWDEYYYSTYNGLSNDQQTYCDFLGEEDFTALYWPEIFYSTPRMKRKPRKNEQKMHYGL